MLFAFALSLDKFANRTAEQFANRTKPRAPAFSSDYGVDECFAKRKRIADCSEAIADVLSVLRSSLAQPGEPAHCVWPDSHGLFSELNSIVRAVMRAAALQRRICVQKAFNSKGHWRYDPGPSFELKHDCHGFGCYLANVPTCHNRTLIEECRNYSSIRPVDYHLLRQRVAAKGLSDMALRAIASRLVIERRAMHVHNSTDYVTMWVRWSDKVSQHEADKVNIEAYVAEAERMASIQHVNNIKLLTVDEAAVAEFATVHPSDRFKYEVASILHEKQSNFQKVSQYLSDFYDVAAGRGAVVTYTSNMARYLRYFRHFDIIQHTYLITSLDMQNFDIRIY